MFALVASPLVSAAAASRVVAPRARTRNHRRRSARVAAERESNMYPSLNRTVEQAATERAAVVRAQQAEAASSLGSQEDAAAFDYMEFESEASWATSSRSALRGAAFDPADGSIAEAAPLGDNLSMLANAMVAFKVGPGRYCYCVLPAHVT